MEVAFQGGRNTHRILKPTLKDILLVEHLRVRKTKLKSRFIHSVVKKPWGAEYMCGANKHVEVWELYIESQSSTSLHCHPDKDTLNIVLEGHIMFETLEETRVMYAGDFVIVKAGAIHRSINKSNQTVKILEVESPPMKYNLIRVRDEYGRENKGYIALQLLRNKSISIAINKCLVVERVNTKQRVVLKQFIRKRKNSKQSRAVHELFIHSFLFTHNKESFIRGDQLATCKNMILIDGTLSLYTKNSLTKLLPGYCMFDVPLSKFSWSTRMARALVW